MQEFSDYDVPKGRMFYSYSLPCGEIIFKAIAQFLLKDENDINNLISF